MENCCVGCEVQDQGIPMAVLNQLNGEPMQEVALMANAELVAICAQLTPAQTELLRAAAESVVNAHGVERARMFHHRFFQRNSLEIPTVANSQIDIGRIVEACIYQWPLDATFTLPGVFIEQAMESTHVLDPNQGRLPICGAVKIDLAGKSVHHYRELGIATEMDLDPNCATVQDVMDDLERILVTIEGVSMVVVEGAESCEPDVLFDLNHWCQFFKRIYGGFEDMWLIMMIDCAWMLSEHALTSEYNSHLEVRHLINRNVDPETLDLITSVDVPGRNNFGDVDEWLSIENATAN